MGLITPAINYTSIKIGSNDVLLSSTARASFTAPYNRIDITMTPTNCSLSYYEVRITKFDDPYDIEVGQCAYWDTNIAANKSYSFSINVNSTNFSAGNVKYRVSLYAKSAVDGSWDVTYLFFTVDNKQFTASDGSSLEVLTTRAAPTHA